MLKFITRTVYHDKIYTTEPELFYKLYKWPCGLFTLLSLRGIFDVIVFGLIGIVCMIFIKPRIIGFAVLVVALLLLDFELSDTLKRVESNHLGVMTPSQIRTLRMEQFIRKFITMNGKALGTKEWKAIKEYDIGLYNDLLSAKCNHFCYYYSLEIARIIKDSILIWGAVEEPFENGHNYYAHAVILRNGYIYDSNMRQSEKYEDFIKLYNFKLYKQWNYYDDYSREDFRKTEREGFRKWCIENNVSVYEKF